MSPTVKLRNATRRERRTYREVDTDSEASDVDLKRPTRQQPTRRSRIAYEESSENTNDTSSSPTDISSNDDQVAKVIPSRTRNRLAQSTQRLSLTKSTTQITHDSSESLSLGRTVRTKRSITYAEISSDDDTTTASLAAPSRTVHRRNASSSSESFSDRNGKSTMNSSRLKRPSPTHQSSRIAFRTTKRQKVDHVATTKPSTIIAQVPILSARIPPWQTLPWTVLRQIMQYAAGPLFTGPSKETGSMRWLLNTSEICESFHDACIGALLLDPPFYPLHRAQHVISLLRASKHHFDGPPTQSDTTSTRASIAVKPSLDYRKKIKTLSIEVKEALVRKGGIDFSSLIENIPLLKNLRFYHNHDSLTDKYIWALPESDRSKVKWSYDAEDVFKILDDNEIVLDSFEWNGRFLRDDPDLNSFLKHNRTNQCLQHLTTLTLRNISLPGADKLHDHVKGETIVNSAYEADEKALKLVSWRTKLLQAIRSMSRLQHLTMNGCNVIDDDFVSQVPDNLISVNLTNLPFVRSEGLEAFLHRGQRSLASLTLRGNQSLSLEFLDNFADDVPNLANLDIDMTYHDPTSYHDTTPLFDDLLSTLPPTWPQSLRSISISPLRNMTQEDAELFFQSLVDAQPDLPHLRILKLRAFLKTASWRDRATLRLKWDSLLNQTFNIKYNEAVHPPIWINPKTGRQSRSGVNSLHLPLEEATGHGRCHIVEIELSDQRPAQDQFKESDFLDSEPEGDGEWNASADAIEAPKYSSRRYAW